MPGCPYFIANTFIHLFSGLLLTGLSTEHPIMNEQDKKPITQFIMGLFSIFLLLMIFQVEVGLLKYGLFALFCFLFGQIINGFVKRLDKVAVLSDTLFIVGAIFVTMTVVGIYDKGNMLAWSAYLYAGLLGLLCATIISMFFSTKERSDASVWISRFVVLLFTLYIGYDVQVLKLHAKKCKSEPDYVNESMNLYLDVLNLFTGVGNSMTN
jgi:FtsH-binding integral membrane protein